MSNTTIKAGGFILEWKDQTFIGVEPKEIITDFETLKSHPDLSPGAFGFLSYDFCRHLEKLPELACDDLGLPAAQFIIPKSLELLPSAIRSPRAASRGNTQYGSPTTKYALPRTPKSNLSQHQFEAMVLRAKEYIAAGDVYQVNLSQRFEVEIHESPFEIYQRLRQINPSPFAAYFDFGGFQLVGCSPERLIKLENGMAETRPIAGTRPKSARDEELLLNAKERAEHIMLVDLERNDLGKVCQYGSVKVDESMVVEEYSHVKHIVSNVIGNLRADKDRFDLLKAMFPGGTITGCPKVRAMQIIEELEPVRRGPYTGSLGYFLPDGRMDFNIIIRTIVIKNKKAYIQVGAGIVADSDPEKEYHETLYKAQALFEAIGS